MARPPQVSRSFPLLTLLMAVPLVAILGYVAYARYVADDAPGDGWKTYRNERFKYEIATRRHGRLTAMSRRAAAGHATTGSTDSSTARAHAWQLAAQCCGPTVAYPARAVAWVNPQGDWCLQRTETEITVSGVKGKEPSATGTALNIDNCKPQPRCRDQPLRHHA